MKKIKEKKALSILVLLCVGALVVFFIHGALRFSEAQVGQGTPFGGQIITNVMPPVQCPSGQGPIILRSVGTSGSSALYSTDAGSRSWTGTPSPGAWVLGFYGQTSNDCFIQLGPYRTNVSTTPWLQYGTSSGGSFGF